jgi:hypothetical protein
MDDFDDFEHAYQFLDQVAQAINSRQLAPGIDYNVPGDGYLYVQMQSSRVDRCKPDPKLISYKALTQCLGREAFITGGVSYPTKGYLRKPDGNVWFARSMSRGWIRIDLTHSDCPWSLFCACRNYQYHLKEYLRGGHH